MSGAPPVDEEGGSHGSQAHRDLTPLPFAPAPARRRPSRWSFTRTERRPNYCDTGPWPDSHGMLYKPHVHTWNMGASWMSGPRSHHGAPLPPPSFAGLWRPVPRADSPAFLEALSHTPATLVATTPRGLPFRLVRTTSLNTTPAPAAPNLITPIASSPTLNSGLNIMPRADSLPTRAPPPWHGAPHDPPSPAHSEPAQNTQPVGSDAEHVMTTTPPRALAITSHSDDDASNSRQRNAVAHLHSERDDFITLHELM